MPSYEVLISNIESKVDTVDENQASFLSMKCRDVSKSIEFKQTNLMARVEKQEKCVDELERRYKQKKNYYELKKLEYGFELQAIQRNNSILYPYKIQKNLGLYFDEYREIEVEYLKHKKQLDKNQNTLLLYDEYLKRLSNCQSRLFKRFSNLAQINESGQHNEDSMISGTEHLPDYGGYESWQQNGMSCLVDGNYEIDSYSSFWQNPVENGTISAGCWFYPDGGLHLGLDIASAMYSDVLAVANGIVLYAHAPVDSNNGYLGNWCGWPNGGGNTICMVVAVNERLYAITYAHLSNEIYVTSGQQVSQGTVIAKSGNSGNSTGPHTHVEVFELKQNLNSIVEYFRNSGADFSFGCGYSEAATCSGYACRIDPETVLEGV
ncbi:M23 family metallopeptidase [uncultured Holdemanella sp.]|uniref:M23 family metallopeptidase n=1 Tax=uncultured Holdemanella sp. TaxID=1763549 RepID=UPI002600A8A3|nr:M23 family metallopeptidase [uncultured Holdemanella sp.]